MKNFEKCKIAEEIIENWNKTEPTIERLKEDLNIMCQRCTNYSLCMNGYGLCRQKNDIENLIERYGNIQKGSNEK